MLTKIKLKDYTTFIQETIFDFTATNSKILESTNVYNKVLKGALFVGENASGKTKTLEAITLLLSLLLSNSDIDILAKKSLYTKGFKYEMEYGFKIDNNDILYNIIFDKDTISREKLYVNNELLIERIKGVGYVYIEDKREVEVDLKLSIVKQEYYKTKFDNNKILNEWFLFLKNSVYVNCGSRTTNAYASETLNNVTLPKYVSKNGVLELNKFLDKLNFNTEVILSKEFKNQDSAYSLNTTNETIALRKKNTDIAIPLALESFGSRTFMHIILPIIALTQKPGMLIIDEFSSGLHNELEESLIKFFFNNSQNSQIFMTTHSTNILDTYLFRPDQIYAFNFDSKKGTIIKRFSSEEPRESQNLEKMYNNGVFNGLPNYNKEFKIK